MNTYTLTMAILMGLTGSLHCAGMCGPIIWVMPFQRLSGIRKTLGIGLYHLGRISVYAVLAAVLHSFKSLFNPQVQQYVSIGMGGMLIVAGLFSFFPSSKFTIKLPWTGFVRKHLGAFMGNPSVGSLFVTGMLNGLLPCGLVYMALSATMVVPDVGQAIAFMYVFGIGTVPMLVALTIIKDRAKFLNFSSARKFVPVVMIAFGCLFMLRGMNLGIPYLSPKVTVEQNAVKAKCCH